jgi:hypothetical protein
MARIVPNPSAFRKRNRFETVTSALRLSELARVLVQNRHAKHHAELSLDPYYFFLFSAKYFICFIPSLLLSSGLSSINSLATTV